MLKKTILKLTLIIITFSANSKTHEVLVSSNVFSPSSLIIEAGDTVRWRNTGGTHNVFANDGSFRCANGCDASGGDGNPSSLAWVAEVTFRQTGIFNYYCQPHVSFGMVGSVTVIEPTSVNIHYIQATVGNDFIPADISIQRGDVVKFSNAGGEHNIHSLDDNMICSESCEGDGFNTETGATGSPWEFYYKFATIEEITYQCDAHTITGNTGIIRVLTDTIFENGFE
ncbi:MAG TPA: plastocyanin/azurin family copper-binding protein [Gammaproteobacteria bacterium]|nr:hypothetical protein [Xanthomonadales bacterium]MCB1593615.1 hypothetical protein [Xanthomonadales bacterium]HPI96711.1 plastocyanin/azurin family copper-binding protein [Gammaproteobacteria bacterium]